MKKFIVAIFMVLVACVMMAGSAFAADPPGIVNISASGTNGSVTITTVAPYVNDTATLTTTGTFNVVQSNRFVSSGQWTGDGNDIDRTASFNGAGTATTTTSYLSTDAWALAAANINTSVTASGDGATGSIHQNMTFDQNNGGVYTQSQWSKQRDMDIFAGGNYVIDVNNTGASIAPSLGSMPSGALPAYVFDFNATAASGNAGLHFDPVIGGNQALSNNGDHGRYTGMSANFVYAFTNSPIVNVTTGTVIGGSVAIVNDFVNKTVSGTVSIQ